MFIVLQIIFGCIAWEKFGLPILKILFPIVRKLRKPFTCSPCLSFWITAFYFLNPFIGFIAYFCTVIILFEFDKATIR